MISISSGESNSSEFINLFFKDSAIKHIAKKVVGRTRITNQEALELFNHNNISELGTLANYIREYKHENRTFFNKNIHIEPTNICVYDCKFCAYSRKVRERGDFDAWELSEDEILKQIKGFDKKGITEVHIVGGVHPKMGLDYFVSLISKIKIINKKLHVKAFTAVELKYMCQKSKVSFRDGLNILKEAGQDSLPGGGAEIFDTHVRHKICKDKCSSEEWLEIHKTAHEIGMPSNATMLYGHYEEYGHLVDHIYRLRKLQDETNGFNAFIPLKFRNQNSQMSNIKEVSILEDLKVYAISRIYLDNFNHIKAYWPMIGREVSQTLLSYGVNDIDGTVEDTTKIYTMAGSEEQVPKMSVSQITLLIKQAKRQAVERDSVYNTLKVYD